MKYNYKIIIIFFFLLSLSAQNRRRHNIYRDPYNFFFFLIYFNIIIEFCWFPKVLFNSSRAEPQGPTLNTLVLPLKTNTEPLLKLKKVIKGIRLIMEKICNTLVTLVLLLPADDLTMDTTIEEETSYSPSSSKSSLHGKRF